MIAGIVILAVLLGICGLISLTGLNIESSYIDGVFRIKIFILKFKVFDNNKSKPKQETEKKQSEKGNSSLDLFLKNKENLITDLKELLNLIKMKAHVRLFKIDIVFGAGDAADTGILTGDLWGIVGIILPLLYSSLKFDTIPEINITPVFNNPCFEICYEGNYTIRLFVLLKIALKALIKFKNYKGGVSDVSTASN